jgi:hypothetical protein
LIAEAGDQPRNQVERAFALALARPPRPEETRAALAFLEKQEGQIKSETGRTKPTPSPLDIRRAAIEAFCLVIFNTNEFVYSN